MKLQNLRLFSAACQHSSIRKAAETLDLSGSAITYAINELETEFGVTLFMKKGRNVTLTKEGMVFYELCSALLDRADATERALHRVAKQNETIKLGLSPLLGDVLFDRVAAELKRMFPDIRLLRYELDSETIQARLLSDALDCAIAPLTTENHALFECMVVGETEYVCCVGPEHPLAESLFVSCAQLQNEPVAIPDRSFDCGRFANQLFERHGIGLDPILETSQMDTIRNLVHAGAAISFVNREYAALFPKQLVGIPLDWADKKEKLYLIWPRNGCASSGLTKLKDCLSRVAPLL